MAAEFNGSDPIINGASSSWTGNGANGQAVHPGGMRLAPAILDRMKGDPAIDAPGMPPNYGQHILPHTMTFQGLVSTVSKCYRMDDEALQHSLQNARFMELDVGIRECLEARSRSVALLNWHLEPDDTTSEEQRNFCEECMKKKFGSRQ